MWGFPSSGSIPAHVRPDHLPVWQGTRFPSLLTQGTRPSQLKGFLQGSCINHPPLQSSPSTGDLESTS